MFQRTGLKAAQCENFALSDVWMEIEMAGEQDNMQNYEEQRKFPRTGVIWPATLQTDAETLKCTVLNLSANGAKLKLHTPMTAGRLMGTVAIPRLGTFKATIAWRADEASGEIGLTFQDPPTDVAEALASVLPASRAAAIT